MLFSARRQKGRINLANAWGRIAPSRSNGLRRSRITASKPLGRCHSGCRPCSSTPLQEEIDPGTPSRRSGRNAIEVVRSSGCGACLTEQTEDREVQLQKLGHRSSINTISSRPQSAIAVRRSRGVVLNCNMGQSGPHQHKAGHGPPPGRAMDDCSSGSAGLHQARWRRHEVGVTGAGCRRSSFLATGETSPGSRSARDPGQQRRDLPQASGRRAGSPPQPCRGAQKPRHCSWKPRPHRCGNAPGASSSSHSRMVRERGLGALDLGSDRGPPPHIGDNRNRA